MTIIYPAMQSIYSKLAISIKSSPGRPWINNTINGVSCVRIQTLGTTVLIEDIFT